MEFTQLINKVVSLMVTDEYKKIPNKLLNYYNSPVDYGVCLVLQLSLIQPLEDAIMVQIVEEMMFKQNIYAHQYSNDPMMFYIAVIQCLNSLVQKHIISAYVINQQQCIQQEQIVPRVQTPHYRYFEISDNVISELYSIFGTNVCFSRDFYVLNDDVIQKIKSRFACEKHSNHTLKNRNIPKEIQYTCVHPLFGFVTNYCITGQCHYSHITVNQFINHPQFSQWKTQKCTKSDCKQPYLCPDFHDQMIDDKQTLVNTMIFRNYPDLCC